MRRVEQRPVVAAFAFPLPPVPMPVLTAVEAKVEGSTARSRWCGHWVSDNAAGRAARSAAVPS